MKLEQELEIVQISIYCDIITMLIKEHKAISLTKLIVFSYLTKKENLIKNCVLRASNTKGIINKYLSLLAGDLENLFASYEYILKAIHILIENEVVELNGIFISRPDKLDDSNFVFEETRFARKAIERAKTLSDKQFMREVLSNV